ncbi:MAG TPA: DUF4105 domain-containing protein [Gammaproteobacteria bacterium]|nr:DUF4105 domain-containing protein [Gammaproteobacteria bacterium]
MVYMIFRPYGLGAILSLLFLLPSTVVASAANFDNIQRLIASHDFDKAVAQASKQSSHYLSELLSQAKTLNLGNHPVWRALMHYKQGVFHDYVSQVDGKNYFISGEGKTNPEAELLATLASFFSTSKIKKTDLLYQCQFPARYYWLDKQLHFSPKKLPRQPCEKFAYFTQALNATGLTVIFPSSHPNSPSSMFGHTLLRFDRAGQTKKDRMLAYTANYAAEDNSDNDFAYAFRGLTGGFVGRFSIIPYYMKLREYSQMENRDLWEYQLNLPKKDVDFIVMHAYELQSTYFDYYFFTENCSYHLLSLIEVAMPELHLTDQFSGPVIPINTVKLLQKNHLISKAAYFPSNRVTIDNRRNLLSRAQYDAAISISKNLNALDLHALKKQTKQQQAAILDLAYDLNRYNNIRSTGILEAKISKAQRQLLIARSALKVKTIPPKDPKYDVTPDEGHDTARLSLGAGLYHGSNFIKLGYRLAYHDVLDPVQGYTPNAQIQFLNVKFKYFPSSSEFQLDKLDVIDILSLEPQDDFFKNISWRINTGVFSAESINSKNKRVYTINGGPGLTYEFDFFKHTFVYGFFESEVNYSEIYNNQVQAFAGFSIGLLTNISSRWTAHMTSKILTNINNRDHDAINRSKFSIAQSYRISKNISALVKVTQTKRLIGKRINAALGINYYF